jgi:hypothetical protein
MQDGLGGPGEGERHCWRCCGVFVEGSARADGGCCGRMMMCAGIVPGGGSALLWASKQLDEVKKKVANMDQRIGVEIIEKALRAPVKVRYAAVTRA